MGLPSVATEGRAGHDSRRGLYAAISHDIRAPAGPPRDSDREPLMRIRTAYAPALAECRWAG
jgi:hypothetical protein